METLHQQYGALLELVRKLIGVVPNCDQYMEIWPPSFRTYNVLVPNFLNLPFALWGVSTSPDLIGLAMYVASRNAGCAYCSAHSTAFALRRGADPDKIARALDGEQAGYTPGELAAMNVAKALARVPVEIKDSHRAELQRHFSPAHVEWIVLGISMMGFLNKFMDAMGIELEGEVVGEVSALLGPSGWKAGKHQASTDPPPARPTPVPGSTRAHGGASLPRPDSFLSKLSLIPLIPSALSHDRQWTSGVPRAWPAVGKYLQEHTGTDFKVLSRLKHERAIRAIAVVLRDNLDAGSSVVGLSIKSQVGIVFSTVVENKPLADDIQRIAEKNRVRPDRLASLAQFARGNAQPPTLGDPQLTAALLLARAASRSPPVIDESILDECRSSGLAAAVVKEIITWISVLQMITVLSNPIMSDPLSPG
ncbi:MAG: carboxymuconolactone decarboxylase family protein [Polyangiaceae bacterium]